MLSHKEMIGLQAEKHDLIMPENLLTEESYVLHLIHTFAYVQAARLAKNKKVLDLGCNTGYGTQILFGSATEVVGADVSEKAILAAKDRYGHLGIGFQLLDGERMPFEDNRFGMVVSFQVIEHIVDYGKYIGELKRLVSPKGIIIFTTPNALLRLDPGMKPWNTFHVREFNHSELKSLLDTFFAKVGILGLFARDELYSIEFNRLQRAREKAREGPDSTEPSPLFFLRDQVKRILPEVLLTQMRSLRSLLSNRLRHATIRPGIEMELMNKYTLRDLFYRPNDLNTCLDLLAFCTDDNESFEEAQRKLTNVVA